MGKFIESKWPTKCAETGFAIAEGEMIYWAGKGLVYGSESDKFNDEKEMNTAAKIKKTARQVQEVNEAIEQSKAGAPVHIRKNTHLTPKKKKRKK